MSPSRDGFIVGKAFRLPYSAHWRIVLRSKNYRLRSLGQRKWAKFSDFGNVIKLKKFKAGSRFFWLPKPDLSTFLFPQNNSEWIPCLKKKKCCYSGKNLDFPLTPKSPTYLNKQTENCNCLRHQHWLTIKSRILWRREMPNLMLWLDLEPTHSSIKEIWSSCSLLPAQPSIYTQMNFPSPLRHSSPQVKWELSSDASQKKMQSVHLWGRKGQSQSEWSRVHMHKNSV